MSLIFKLINKYLCCCIKKEKILYLRVSQIDDDNDSLKFYDPEIKKEIVKKKTTIIEVPKETEKNKTIFSKNDLKDFKKPIHESIIKTNRDGIITKLFKYKSLSSLNNTIELNQIFEPVNDENNKLNNTV